MVKGVMQDGEWVTNPQQVKTAFYNFYKVKFEASDSMMDLPPVTPQVSLNSDDNIELEKSVNMQEIRAVNIVPFSQDILGASQRRCCRSCDKCF